MIKEIIMKLLVILVFSLPLTSNALTFRSIENQPGFMIAEGEIERKDDKRLEKFVERNNIHTVEWNSIGGLMSASLNIGMYIREHNLNTVLRNGSICHSGCAYAFMGGIDREIEDGGNFAMHRPYFLDAPKGSFEDGYTDGVNTVILVTSYLTAMGLSYEYAVGHLMFRELVPVDDNLQKLFSITTK